MSAVIDILHANIPSQIFSDSLRASSLSFASCAARNRRDRCWFILARGATPSERPSVGTENHRTWIKEPTNCHKQQLARSNHVNHSLGILKNFNHHFFLRLGSRLSINQVMSRTNTNCGWPCPLDEYTGVPNVVLERWRKTIKILTIPFISR